jgi:hypothetical protein
MRCLQWPYSIIYCDAASAAVRVFILIELSGAEQSCYDGRCQGSEFVFIQDVLPHLPSTNHVNAELYCTIRSPRRCYKSWYAHSDAVQSLIWPLHAQFKHTLAFRLSYNATIVKTVVSDATTRQSCRPSPSRHNGRNVNKPSVGTNIRIITQVVFVAQLRCLLYHMDTIGMWWEHLGLVSLPSRCWRLDRYWTIN